MGAVDLVVQIESPPSVASALQRVGRAGHHVGEVSRGVLFPKHRGDLVPSAVTVERMRTGGIEALHVPASPLDVLAQQVVAATSLDTWDADDLFDVVRRAAPFTSLPRSAYDATLDLLSGRYPSDEFAELRPRLVWDRVSGELTGRPGAQRLAVTSGGTIPDRGLFGVFLVGEKASRVGELDEEMVYESRVGDVFTLGTTSWRIEDITHDRVLVSPAPGQPGRLPFWTGDSLGRPAELGEAIGAFTREVAAMPREQAIARATAAGLDEWAADNLVSLIEEQREATNAVPHDQQLVVERFRDELGDWRLVVHSPYGTPVHAPWALAINGRLRERYGVDAAAMATDDGIVLRIPETDQDPPGAELIAFEPDEIEQIVTTEVGGSALFASRFRECAARALLLPRRDPGRRAPLWQQRQRSAQLLEVAARYPSFPIILETIREVLQDVYDLPSLVALHRRISERRLRLVDVNTQRPSPFAQSLLFGYVAAFMYEGDSPIAERRAAALTLDQGLLAELLGRAELRELLDPEVLAEVESELQRLAEDRRVRDSEGIADLLRLLGSAVDRRGPGALHDARPGDRLALPARRRPPRRARADGRPRTLGGRRGRRPAPRRARRAGAAGRPGRVHRAGRGPAGRPGRPLRPHPRPVPRLRGGPATRSRRRRLPADAGPARRAGARARGRVPAVRVPAPSGATPRCCGPCGVVRSPGSATRSSPSSRSRWRGSCPRGRTSCSGGGRGLRGLDGVVTRRRAARRLRRTRLGAGVPRAAGPGARLPARRCSTSSPRPARSSGPATADCPAPTGGSRCTSPTPLP